MPRAPLPSVAFDRVADRYDASRSLSPEATAALTSVLGTAVADRGPVLEVGVGTGRIALPLAAAGVEVVGVDLSEPMLRRLAEKGDAVPVARADATALPFPEATFGAVVAAHLLHLVPEWRAAVLEALRVLRPDGVLLWARGGHGAPEEALARVFAEAAGLDRTPVGLDAVEGLDAYLRSRQWRGTWLPDVADDRETTGAALLDLFASGDLAWTWGADEQARARGVAAARAWAAAEGVDLDAPRPAGRPVRFRAYAAMAGPAR